MAETDPILAVLEAVAAGRSIHHGYDAGVSAGDGQELHRRYCLRMDAVREAVRRDYLTPAHQLTSIGRDVLRAVADDLRRARAH